MAFYEVYSHPALIRYQTSVCTKATLFLLVVLCLTYISPLLVAYRSQGRKSILYKFWANANLNLSRGMCDFAYRNTIQILGFWIKRATYEEQPVVRFQYQTLLVAATSIQGDFVAWSTFPHLNNMLASKLRIPALSVRNNRSPIFET